MKKIITAIICLMLLLTLFAGCDKGETTPVTSGTSSAPTIGGSDSAVTESSAQSTVTGTSSAATDGDFNMDEDDNSNVTSTSSATSTAQNSSTTQGGASQTSSVSLGEFDPDNTASYERVSVPT